MDGILLFVRDILARKYAAWAACALAALLLLLTLINFGTDIYHRSKARARLQEKVVIAKPKQATLPEQIAVGMFGKRPISADMIAPSNSSLKLDLNGILATADGKGGSATISAPGVGEHTYTVGDILPGNAQIKAIFSDRVVIERNKRLETLLLPIGGLPPQR